MIHSGGGLHGYWLLSAPVDLLKSAKPFEEALLRVTQNVQGDKSRAEIASMMRMPGTRNMKPERNGFVASIEKMDLSPKYELTQFLGLPSSTPAVVNASIPTALATAIVQGNRDQGAFNYINAVVKQHGSSTDDQKLASEVEALLRKAGGHGLDAIIAKIPNWITTAHALFDPGAKPTPLQLADAIKEAYGGLVLCVGGQLRIYQRVTGPSRTREYCAIKLRN